MSNPFIPEYLTDMVDDPKAHGVVAILSSTVLTREGEYRYVPFHSMPVVAGIPHYVGHPAMRHILDTAGAVYKAGYFAGYFAGLDVGESYLACQLRDPRKGTAFTADAPNVDMTDLKFSIVTRIK